MAGSISLLHEAVRLEANRENFKALTKYLGALAAVSHALLEICEHGSDALYTSIFEEKIGIVARCYDRINSLFADLTKPDPPTPTTIAAPVPRSRRNSKSEPSQIDNFKRRSICSNMPFYENLPSNGPKEEPRAKSCRRYRQYGTLPKSKDYADYQKPISPSKLVDSIRFRPMTPSVSSVENVSGASSSAALTIRPRLDISPSVAKSMPSMTSTLPSSLRVSKARNSQNSNFGTILTTLNSQQSVFYDVPTSPQGVYDRSPYQTLGGEYDSDIEAERELPNLQDIIGADTVRHLADKERKRQQAIIELFHIERMHVGRLKVMYRVFYKPLSQNQLLSRNFVDLLPLNMLQLLFANIEEILQAHMAINRAMKSILRERRLVTGVGDLMMSFLDTVNGDQLKNAAVTFCQYQQYALDMLKTKRKEDKKFSVFLEKAENNPMCRGFPLRDLLPGEMKHLSRYPLLLENILKYTPEHWEETWKLRHGVKCAKEILQAVNSAKRNFDNARKLCEIRDKLDLNPFYMTDHEVVNAYPNFDLTKYNLVFDGNLKWRIGKKTIDIYAIVLDSILLLLTVSDYDRYRLMFYELRVNATNGRNKKIGPVKFSPLLELTKLNPRTSPTDERAFYLICKSPPYAFTYELVAPSVHERRNWMKLINDQSEICKRQEDQFTVPLRRNLFDDDTLHARRQSSSAETGHTFSSGNESQENFYERIDTCSSCNSESDSDIFTNIDEYSTTANGVLYDTVPASSEPNTTSASPTFLRTNAVDQYDIPPIPVPIDYASMITALCACEQSIVQEMRKRREILAHIFEIADDDFSNIADLMLSFRGPKTMIEHILVATDELNKLLSLIHWTENSVAPVSTAGYEQPSMLRKSSVPISHSNWIQMCLAPKLTPSLLALMRYMHGMLQLTQTSMTDSMDCDTLRLKL